jgi:exodeoxyribonuclease VII large subunit
MDGSLELSSTRLSSGIERMLAESRERLATSAASLDGLSPLKVFDRGYIICEKGGAPVLTVTGLQSSDEVHLRFRDGDARAEVRSSEVRGGN